MTAVRAGLPPMPPGIEKLRVDHRGYPVPYFAAWVSESGAPRTRGYRDARPEFRLLYPGVVADCVEHNRCWVCGAARQGPQLLPGKGRAMTSVDRRDVRRAANALTEFACGELLAVGEHYVHEPSIRLSIAEAERIAGWVRSAERRASIASDEAALLRRQLGAQRATTTRTRAKLHAALRLGGGSS